MLDAFRLIDQPGEPLVGPLQPGWALAAGTPPDLVAP